MPIKRTLGRLRDAGQAMHRFETSSPCSSTPNSTPESPLEFALKAQDVDIMTTVRKALAEHRVRLAFQPVVAAEGTGAKTKGAPVAGQAAFYEGLIRLLDEKGRVIPARYFMQDVEETALGREIDCASLKAGIAALGSNPALRISINASARSIADVEWRRTLEQGLAGNATLGERLILEVNESSAMLLPEVMIRFMREMQPYGVSFALDDFGGGVTAFRHLKDFLFDLVKIDPCYIRNIHNDPDHQVLTEALITVAQQFEMFVVAPGIECAEEAALVKALGADCLQGYHLGLPKFSF